jgi:DNA helicase-2/ATP-dependent DNA helicase PcrA
VRVFKYAGPPGTGKSTELLNVLDRLLASGVVSEDIVFTTFTKAGANEARDRAVRRFHLSKNRLPYFKTLHALCYAQIERSVDVMTGGDWCEIAKKIGVYFSIKSADEGIPRGTTKGDNLLTLWALSRVLIKELKEVWLHRTDYAQNSEAITLQELEHFVATVTAYKKDRCKMDYTDMLEVFLIEGTSPGASHVIVDEAQDLSPLQWAVVRKLSAGCKELHVAGDDDQAIHEWNGASPKHFIDHTSHEFKVLPQSYRIPSEVHKLAQKISSRIKTRIQKTYKPKEDEGAVVYVSSINDDAVTKALGSGESWFMLVRNHSLSAKFVELCRHKGLLFTSQGSGESFTMIPAIAAWERLRTGGSLDKAEAELLYNWMGVRDRIVYGAKTTLSRSTEANFDHKLLVKSYGMLASTSMGWSEALTKIGDEDRAYIRAVEKNGSIANAPKIEIATIHAVKGREADNILILPDMSYQTHKGFEENEDAEHRVWYVGVTRAKKRVFIPNPTTHYFYNL